MSEQEVAERLMRIARYRTRDWQGHAEYDDMLAEAHLRAWKSYQKAVAQGMTYPFQIAALGAAYAPMQWLERWHGRSRRAGDARSRVEFVPLMEADHLPAPSPEEEALDRLERIAAWERLGEGAGQCSAYQQRVLYRLFILGEGPVETAAALGTGYQSVCRARDRALAHCRPATARIRRAGRLENYAACRKGHPLTPENRMLVRQPGRIPAIRCRACQNESRRRCRARWRAAASQETASSGGAGH